MAPTNKLTQPAIRRIRPQDAEAWREVRLRALLDAPDAFGSTHAETLARPPGYWSDRAARSATGSATAIFLADGGNGLLGLVGGNCPPGQSEVRELISMWVAPAARGTGLAERLVAEVVDWSADAGSSRVELWVTESNERARRLYARIGFTLTDAQQAHPSNPALAEIQMRLDDHVPTRRARMRRRQVRACRSRGRSTLN